MSGKFMGQGYDEPILPIRNPQELYFNQKLRSTSLEKVYSSPSLRCLQTAKLLKTDAKTVVDERLIETDMGDFTGLNIQQVKAQFPDEYYIWQKQTDQHKFPNGESYQQVESRASEFLNELVQKNLDNVAIFSHVDVIKMMISYVLKLPKIKKNHFFIKNGSLSKLRYDDHYGFRVEYFNSF